MRFFKLNTIRTFIQDNVLPDLKNIKEENSRILIAIDFTNKRLDDVNKRLDDVNAHLVDQSRRIDALRTELKQDIKGVRVELKQDIEGVRVELKQDIEGVRVELKQDIEGVRVELKQDIKEVRTELNQRIEDVRTELVQRLDINNQRLDYLTQAIVRRDEHEKLETRVSKLEDIVTEIKEKVAA